MLSFVTFLFGLALGLWAGRKHALHPQYFATLLERLRK